MSPNSNRVLNLEPVRLRPLALRITSVVTACTLLITTLLPAMLAAQPVPVNPIAPQTFQGQDFDPFFNSALGSATQGQWESLIDQGKYLLAAQWEADIDAQIAQEVAAVTQSDHFNSVAEYQDYLRSEYELQKQTAYAGWEIAAEARIEAERVAFLQALSEKERLAAEQDSDAAIDAGASGGLTPTAVTAQQKNWQDAFAADIAKGMLDFQTAMGDLEREYTAFMAELDAREAQFEQQRLAIKAREQIVRQAIAGAVDGMESYLQGNALFYTETCDGVNQCAYTSEGANLQSLIDDLRTGLNADAPLSALAGLMNTYLATQAQYAATRQTYWGARIRNNNYTPGETVHAPMFGHTTVRWNQHHMLGWRPVPIEPHIHHLINIGALVDWGGVYGTAALNAVVKFNGGSNVEAEAYLKNRYMHSGVQITQIHSMDLCGTTIGTNGSPWHSWCYRNHGNLAFAFVDVGTSAGHMSTNINTELYFNIHTSFAWYDPNADHNFGVWSGYINDLTPVVNNWNNNILPAIQNWEAQVATYNADHAAWQAQADANRMQATADYEQRLETIGAQRNTWLSRMEEEYRSGQSQWTAIAGRSDAQSAAATVVPVVTAAAARPVLTHQSILSQANLDFLNRTVTNVPDASLLTGLDAQISRTARGIQQTALAGAMNDYAVDQQKSAIERMVAQLQSVGGVVTGEADNRLLEGFHVQVGDDGSIRATRQIHSGRAERVGGDGTSMNDYTASLKEQEVEIAPPPSLKLVKGGSLFDEAWDVAALNQEFAQNKEKLQETSTQSNKLFEQSLENSQFEMNRNMQQFMDDRSGKMAAAQIEKERAKGPFGGALQSIATAMFSGGISLQQAVTQHMQNEVASHVAKATGLPVGIFSSMIGGASMHDSVKSYVKSETDNLMTGAIVKATGLPAGFIGGMVSGGKVDFSGESMKAAFNSYADELAAEKLEEATGIPGFAGFLKRTTIADKNAKLAAKKAAVVKPEDIATGGATYVWRNADHNENLAVGLQAAETVAGAAAIGSGAGTAAFAGYMAAKQAYKGHLAGDSNETILKKAAASGVASVANHYLSSSTGGAVSIGLNYTEGQGFGGSVSASVPIKGVKVGGSLNFQEGQGYTGGSITAGLSHEGGGAGLNASLNFDKTGFAGGSIGASYSGETGFGGSANLNFSKTGNITSAGVDLTYKTKENWAGKDGNVDASGVSGSGTHTAGLGLTMNADGSGSMRAINNVSGKDTYGIGLNSADVSSSLSINFDKTGAHTGHSTNISVDLGFQTQDEKEAAMSNRLAALEEKFLTKPETATEEELAEYYALKARNNSENRAIASERYIERMVHQGKLTPEQAEELRKDPEKWHTAEYAKKLLANGDSEESRTGILDKITGAIADAGRWLTGSYSTADGFLDPDTGEFVARTCFVAGTLVRVHSDASGAFERNGNWYKKIEEITVGDRALSWNEETGVVAYNVVTETFVNETTLIYKIQYADGTRVETTWNHPFYIAGRGWVEVKDLRAGEVSLTAISVESDRMLARAGAHARTAGLTDAGGSQRIARITKEWRNEVVYNFEVAGDHTYFVTDADVLVHNYEGEFASNMLAELRKTRAQEIENQCVVMMMQGQNCDRWRKQQLANLNQGVEVLLRKKIREEIRENSANAGDILEGYADFMSSVARENYDRERQAGALEYMRDDYLALLQEKPYLKDIPITALLGHLADASRQLQADPERALWDLAIGKLPSSFGVLSLEQDEEGRLRSNIVDSLTFGAASIDEHGNLQTDLIGGGTSYAKSKIKDAATAGDDSGHAKAAMKHAGRFSSVISAGDSIGETVFTRGELFSFSNAVGAAKAFWTDVLFDDPVPPLIFQGTGEKGFPAVDPQQRAQAENARNRLDSILSQPTESAALWHADRGYHAATAKRLEPLEAIIQKEVPDYMTYAQRQKNLKQVVTAEYRAREEARIQERAAAMKKMEYEAARAKYKLFEPALGKVGEFLDHSRYTVMQWVPGGDK